MSRWVSLIEWLHLVLGDWMIILPWAVYGGLAVLILVAVQQLRRGHRILGVVILAAVIVAVGLIFAFASAVVNKAR